MPADPGDLLDFQDAIRGNSIAPRVQRLVPNAQLPREGLNAPGSIGDVSNAAVDHGRECRHALPCKSTPTEGAKLVGADYHLIMDTLGSRIRHAREAKGMTQDDVASSFGIRRVSVTQWEAGTTKPAIGKLGELAELLGTTTAWLLEGQGPAPNSGEGTARRAVLQPFRPQVVPGSELVGARDFPIYAAAEGGNGHLIVTFDPIEVVKRPAILEGVKGAYGLLVSGDSMEPAYDHGDMALVHPGLGPGRLVDVVLYDHPPNGDAEAIIKRLVGWTEREWHLRQFNPAKDFPAFRADWPTCHRVVGKYARR